MLHSKVEVAHLDDPAAAACLVCEKLRGHSDEFLSAVSGRPEDAASVGEAVVDSLGFCGHHGLLLARECHTRPGIARVLHSATDQMIAWLSDEKRHTDRLSELFFNADRTCLGCNLRDQFVTRRVHQVTAPAEWHASARWLCFQHYRAIAYTLKSPALPELANAQLQLLQSVLSRIGPIVDKRPADASAMPVAAETLTWALRVIGSDAGLDCGASRLVREGRKIRSIAINATTNRWQVDAPCPVCAEIRNMQERWLASVTTVARLGQDLWTVFPTCPAHVASCARFGEPQVALLAARYAATLQLAALQRGIVAIKRDNSDRETARRSVFYRRQNAGYILGQQRKMITCTRRCPACERMFVAQGRGIGHMVQRLRDVRPGQRREVCRELCLKHFASVYMLVAPGPIGSALVATQSETLHQLRDSLAKSSDGDDSSCDRTAVQESVRVWSTFMQPLSGHP